MKKLILVLLAVAAILLVGLGVLVNSRGGQDFLLERALPLVLTGGSPPIDGLSVHMCGTSSPLPAPDRAQACVAVRAGDALYVVDVGAGSARTANLMRLPLGQLKAILLTHFHSDHIAELYDFNLGSWVAGRPEPLAVIGPAGVTGVVDGINAAYEQDRSYRVAHHGFALLPPQLGVLAAVPAEPGVILDEAGLRITMFEVDHMPVDPAVGYRFDYRGRSIVISGDSVVTDTLAAAARDADLLLHDGLSLPIVQGLENAARSVGQQRRAKIFADIQDYHAANANLAGLQQETGVRQLAVYHLVPPPRNFLMEQVFKRDLPDGTVLTEDGMVFELPSGSDEIVVR